MLVAFIDTLASYVIILSCYNSYSNHMNLPLRIVAIFMGSEESSLRQLDFYQRYNYNIKSGIILNSHTLYDWVHVIQGVEIC